MEESQHAPLYSSAVRCPNTRPDDDVVVSAGGGISSATSQRQNVVVTGVVLVVCAGISLESHGSIRGEDHADRYVLVVALHPEFQKIGIRVFVCELHLPVGKDAYTRGIGDTVLDYDRSWCIDGTSLLTCLCHVIVLSSWVIYFRLRGNSGHGGDSVNRACSAGPRWFLRLSTLTWQTEPRVVYRPAFPTTQQSW